MSQPMKKRKLAPTGPDGSQGKQNGSFTEVLEQYDLDARGAGMIKSAYFTHKHS